MLKDAGEEGVKLVRQLAEAVFSSGMIPVGWEESLILNLYKGKSEALTMLITVVPSSQIKSRSCWNVEWVLNFSVRQMVNINEMQFVCVPVRGTTDTIIIARQLQQ